MFVFFVKIWAHPGWTPLKTLSGHEQKVTSVDVAPGEIYQRFCMLFSLMCRI